MIAINLLEKMLSEIQSLKFNLEPPKSLTTQGNGVPQHCVPVTMIHTVNSTVTIVYGIYAIRSSFLFEFYSWKQFSLRQLSLQLIKLFDAPDKASQFFFKSLCVLKKRISVRKESGSSPNLGTQIQKEKVKSYGAVWGCRRQRRFAAEIPAVWRVCNSKLED